MASPLPPDSGPKPRLDQIETDWSMVHEPAHLVGRYANAVQRYLFALIKNKHDAEEVAQEFFLWVSQHGMPRIRQERGRFRDYLKAVVRNSALNFLRRHRPTTSSADLPHVPAPQSQSIPDKEWVVHWRRCLLRRTWRRLAQYQQRTEGNLFFTVLQLCAAHPQEDSKALAERAAQQCGRPIRADAFRKQVSRARRMFANCLVKEVADTLDKPTVEDVEEELVDLGLMVYVRDFLPLRNRPHQP